MKNLMSFLAGMLILATSIIGLLFMVGIGHAATYNFYFNNLEQGDNSTANPSLTVMGKKSKRKSEEKTVTTTEKTTVETTEGKPAEKPEEQTEVSETVSDSLRVPPAEAVVQKADSASNNEDEEAE